MAPGGDFATGRHRPWSAVGGAAAIAALGAALFGFHLGSYGLWEPDEARYAEIAREMLALRDFLVPHLNYVPYVEKPPLLYWITALSFRIFGLSEFAARLAPALAAMLGLLATWLFASMVFGRRCGIAAGAILATTPLYVVMAQVLNTDMLLTAMLTVAFFALFLHWRDGGQWCWLAYVAIALALLTKGPIGIVLPALVSLVFLWLERDLRGALRRFQVVAGLALIIAIAAPWFIYMTLTVPGFFDFYFIGEHLRRFLQRGYSHNEPIYFYLPVIAAGLLPWSAMALFLDWRALRLNAAHRFCLITALVVFVFFSLARAKLIPYMLPVFPPLAVLIGDAIVRTIESRPWRLVAAAPILGMIGATAVAIAILTPASANPYLVAARPALAAVASVALAGGVLASIPFWTNRAAGRFEFAILVLCTALVLMAGSYGRLAAEPLRSFAELCTRVAAKAPNARLICYRRYVQALPFYTRRRVILVGAKTELAFGAAHSPNADQWFFYGEPALLRLWRAPGDVVVLIDRTDLDHLQSRLGRFSVIGSEWKKIAIRKPADTAAGR